MTNSTIFLSHSSRDKEFVRKLGKDLRRMNYSIWFDEWEILVGDFIPNKIEEGLDKCSYLILVLSSNSTKSNWVDKEWKAKYWDEINNNKTIILPLIIDDCEIPTLLKGKKYADFRLNYSQGLSDLVMALIPKISPPSIEIPKYLMPFISKINNKIPKSQIPIFLFGLNSYGKRFKDRNIERIRKYLNLNNYYLLDNTMNNLQDPETKAKIWLSKAGILIINTNKEKTNALGPLPREYSFLEGQGKPILVLHEGNKINILNRFMNLNGIASIEITNQNNEIEGAIGITIEQILKPWLDRIVTFPNKRDDDMLPSVDTSHLA